MSPVSSHRRVPPHIFVQPGGILTRAFDNVDIRPSETAVRRGSQEFSGLTASYTIGVPWV
jgi:hypothetical protein